MKKRLLIALIFLVVMILVFIACGVIYSINSDYDNIGKIPGSITEDNIDNENNNSNNIGEVDNNSNINDNKKDTTVSNEHDSDNIENVDKTEDDDECSDRSSEEFESLSSEKISWWYVPNSNHEVPGINDNLSFNILDYGAMYIGDTDRKVLYLTMDEGYENGYTSKILDTLKDNDVKATFFVLSSYIKENPELVQRMVDEGHVVGNHSKKHIDPTTLTDNKEKYEDEILAVEDDFKSLTGRNMTKYYRPPEGAYSQKSLQMNENLGYKTVFWSFAYKDWEIDNQPDPQVAKEKILGSIHNGAIILLHPISSTNAEVLDDVIKEAKNMGYTFEVLP